jgi:signal transduction histidine kinase
MQNTYEKSIYQFLSIYRFFTFALAVVLMQVLPLQAQRTPDLQTIAILASLGAYSFFQVLSRLRWRQKGPMTYILLGGDLTVCIVLLLYTGGLSSGLLLYSLTPVITAALLFEERIAISMAILTSFFLAAGHIGLSQFTDRLAWIMDSNNLALLILYIIASFLIAALSYRININIRRHIEQEAILGERRRLRREIHDGVAQALTYLNLKTKQVTDSVSSQQIEKALSGLEDVRTMVQNAYEDVRETIDQLSAEAQSFPLLPTLADYIREFGEKNRIKTRFDASTGLFDLSPIAELQLMRIAQEALTNIRRHAKATEAWVRVDNTPKEVRLMVGDNGRGFSLADSEKDVVMAHGLNVMKERAESLGGTLDIVTAPGAGTEIRVSLPGEKVRL